MERCSIQHVPKTENESEKRTPSNKYRVPTTAVRAPTLPPIKEESEHETSILRDIVALYTFDRESNASCTMRIGHSGRDLPATCWVRYEGRDAPTEMACEFCRDVALTATRLRRAKPAPEARRRHLPETPAPSLPKGYTTPDRPGPFFCEVSCAARAAASVAYENGRSRWACAACLRDLDVIRPPGFGIDDDAVARRDYAGVVSGPWAATDGAVARAVAERCLAADEEEESDAGDRDIPREHS